MARSEIIPENWYPVFLAERLGRKKPVGVRRLGQDLVLWRDQAGKAHAAHRGCPHRGADLGQGFVQDGELVCPYHGFRFEGGGACTAIPCEGKDARIPPRLRLRTLPLVEERGVLWLFAPGDDEVDPLSVPRPFIEGMPETHRGLATRELEWEVPLSRLVEGMVDIHHASFAHRRYFPTKLTRLDPYDAHVDEGGVIRSKGLLRREDRPGQGWWFVMDVAPPSVIAVSFGQELPSRLGGLVLACPVDDERCWIAFRYYFRFPVLGRLLAEIAVWTELAFIQPDDYRMLRTSFPKEGGTEHGQLVHADKAAGLWHSWRRAALHGQAKRPTSLPVHPPADVTRADPIHPTRSDASPAVLSPPA